MANPNLDIWFAREQKRSKNKMGNWSLTGILLTVGLFLAIFGFILTQIQVTNPLTGQESSVFSTIIGWIIP